ncbi:hypothetical protein AOQ84DRAFT_335546 [Glonium stellatum]|uniref:DUF676 domain-containing protein n=1 Tax=Glonium stellatum TaxID=574774 RepID=A0A8E2JVX7_9PEZI|nr:hypothetical protein AOQ84DRAFT_335546 [Glonium stellatum]
MPRWFSLYIKNTPRDGDLPPPTTPKKTFSSGLRTLYYPEDAIVDIVFVHGLTGDRDRTWTALGATTPWPETLLPKKIPQARILAFGYDAYVADWRAMVSNNRIGNHARNLLAALATYREGDYTNKLPIIFVAHSLGGLVCEDALISSRNSAEAHLHNIFDYTRGIAFLGTPHSGSGFARWAEQLAKLIGLIKQTNSQILEILRTDSEVLARIQADFHMMLRARIKNGSQQIAITCFFEELPLPGIGEVVVPMHSAIIPAYMSIGIHSNHMTMTKFETEDDPGFISVTGELQRWVKELKPPPP